MPIATATTTAFLIIYCPSRVGTNDVCHIISGSSTSGEHTKSICASRRGITMRVILGNKNSIPITHSITDSRINNVSKCCIPIVCAVNAWARGLAGLSPSNLIIPNQKKIKKIEKRATGICMRLKKSIIFRSRCV